MTSSNSPATMPCLTFNHGSGRGDGVSNFLHKYVQGLPDQPTGIIVAEAHLVHGAKDAVQVLGTAKLATTVNAHLRKAGIRSQMFPSNLVNSALYQAHGCTDAKRAFNNIPMAVLSVPSNDSSASESLSLGRALAPLRKQGILILGSGIPSFHNFALLGAANHEQRHKHGEAFNSWLVRTLAMSDVDARAKLLSSWRSAPSALQCHPDGDSHFSPTLIVAGASSGPGRPVHDESQPEILTMTGPRGWSTLHHFEFK